MILVGFTFVDVLVKLLYVSLVLLVLIILYRLVLRRFSRGAIDSEDYCELYTVEMNPAHGEIPFYFTSQMERQVKFSLLDEKMELIEVLKDFECSKGGNIIRFDSSKLANGNYFYQLETDNQKVIKKLVIVNR